MRIATKLLSIIMTAVLAFGMAGCAKTGKAGKADIKELQ